MNRVFLLMAEFQAADIPLERVVAKYYPELSEREWKRKAAAEKFPFRTFRADKSQKSTRFVSVIELAQYLDKQEAEAAKDWKASA